MYELNIPLEEISLTPLLLVATDFDGTLAPIVSDPALAEADRETTVALRTLAGLPQTHVAVISGRALADLATRVPTIDHLHLVGSHGGEFEPGFASPLPPEALKTHGRLVAELNRIGAADLGFLVEVKPAAVAFHYRNAPDEAAAAAIDAVLAGPAKWEAVKVRHGKKVIELSVVDTNKGLALQKLRQRLSATAVLFIGDDVTDEDAFAVLTGPDIGIKVGAGPTSARYRLENTEDVARVLARVTERRAAWLAGSEAIPIDRHAILSDQRTMALLNPAGRVVWLCLPRLDSSPIFAELLGGPTAGFFEITPADRQPAPRQSYLPDTFLLRTEWPGMAVTDYLDCAGGRAFQRAGRTDLVRVVEGRGHVRIVFSPRLDFGRVQTRLRPCEDNGLEIEGTLDPIVLRSPGVKWELIEQGQHQTAVAHVELSEKPLVLELRYGTGNLADGHVPEPARRDQNQKFWRNWAQSLVIPDIASDLVRRSALVLRSLVYGPTGAIAAAATTSLPEHAGGVRNWDYRFCWPRDAALSAAALVRLGVTGPGMRFLDWLLGILENSESGMLRPVYTLTGGYLGPEAEISEMAGYLGSRPVRVGNAAGQQIQLDVLGPIADLLALLAERGAALSSEHWRMLEKIVSAVDERWREPDHGIWEIRGPRQHYVHSKVMCWQTVDRMLRVARYLGKRRPAWEELRATIAADVLANGFKPECNSFCATYAGYEPDAAALSVGLSGLLPPDDLRVIGTLDHVEKHLCTDGMVYRYRYDDGLPGAEGGFLLCNAWLIESCVMCGRIGRARELFEKLCALAGPTGLFAEEWDPESRRSLGNFPQAYTHLGLINAALRLDRIP